MRPGAAAFALAALLFPTPIGAQALQCRVPETVPQPRAEYAPQERRVTPVAGYTLALSWSPEFCRTRLRDRAHRLQCGGLDNGGAGRFGFILHGLWPESDDARWPQWCRRVPALSRERLRPFLCTTPSTRLLQHQWAKHGSCMTRSPRFYLRAGRRLFRAVRYPDMNALSRNRNLTAGQFARAFAAANRRMSADMLQIVTNDRGWLTEVRICLGRDFRMRRCPAWQRGTAARSRLAIWRGRR